MKLSTDGRTQVGEPGHSSEPGPSGVHGAAWDPTTDLTWLAGPTQGLEEGVMFSLQRLCSQQMRSSKKLPTFEICCGPTLPAVVKPLKAGKKQGDKENVDKTWALRARAQPSHQADQNHDSTAGSPGPAPPQGGG